jgi:hypothetical protein
MMDFDVKVRAYTYDRIMNTGRIPLAAEVAHGLGRSLEEVRGALGRLHEGHVVVLQESGEVLMANPFSSVPTPFVVEASGRDYWGNCIWDALGILAMLGVDGRVVTSCADCNEAMSVEIQGGKLVDDSAGVIHFAVPAARWWDNIRFT